MKLLRRYLDWCAWVEAPRKKDDPGQQAEPRGWPWRLPLHRVQPKDPIMDMSGLVLVGAMVGCLVWALAAGDAAWKVAGPGAVRGTSSGPALGIVLLLSCPHFLAALCRTVRRKRRDPQGYQLGTGYPTALMTPATLFVLTGVGAMLVFASILDSTAAVNIGLPFLTLGLFLAGVFWTVTVANGVRRFIRRRAARG